MNDHTYGPSLTSIAAEIEEHLHIASVALLHVALGNSTMEETVQAADAMRLDYRIKEEEGIPESSGRAAVSLDDTIKVLRAIEHDLDHYHYRDLGIATVTEFRALLDRLDGESDDAKDQHF